MPKVPARRNDTRALGTLPESVAPGYIYRGHGSIVCGNDGAGAMRLKYEKVPKDCILIVTAKCGKAVYAFDEEIELFREWHANSGYNRYMKGRVYMTGLFSEMTRTLRDEYAALTAHQTVAYDLEAYGFHVYYPGDRYVDIEYQPMDPLTKDFRSGTMNPFTLYDFSEEPVGFRTLDKDKSHADLLEEHPVSVMAYLEKICDVEGIDLDDSYETNKLRKHLTRIEDYFCEYLYADCLWPSPSFAKQTLKDISATTIFGKDRRDHNETTLRQAVNEVFEALQDRPFRKNVSELMSLYKGVHYFNLCRSAPIGCERLAETHERRSPPLKGI